MDAINWVVNHWQDIMNVLAYVIAGASIIVKLTPSPKDDTVLAGVVAFLSKYIALNKVPEVKNG